MKNVVVLFDAVGKHDSPFDHKTYLDGYKELHDKALKSDIKIIFARGGPDAYVGNGLFTNCSTFEDAVIVDHKDTIAAAVLDKSKYFIPKDDLNCINHCKIKEICGDKVATYKLFKSISPHTEVIETAKQLQSIIAAKPDDKIVLKPNFGSAGKEVIIDVAKHINTATITFPIILQEFIDSSGGIQDLTDGLHDFRVIVANGEIIFSFIRTPGKDSYLAGLATGGTIVPIPISKIPDKVISITRIIDNELNFSNTRLYTVDLAYNGSDYKLIELNSQPGISGTSLHQEYEQLQEGIVALIRTIT